MQLRSCENDKGVQLRGDERLLELTGGLHFSGRRPDGIMCEAFVPSVLLQACFAGEICRRGKGAGWGWWRRRGRGRRQAGAGRGAGWGCVEAATQA